VQRIARVEDADAVQARDVEVVARLGELARDPERVGEGVDEPHARARDQRHVDARRVRDAIRPVGTRIVRERDGGRQDDDCQRSAQRGRYTTHVQDPLPGYCKLVSLSNEHETHFLRKPADWEPGEQEVGV
jgi:hypothetical protein